MEIIKEGKYAYIYEEDGTSYYVPKNAYAVDTFGSMCSSTDGYICTREKAEKYLTEIQKKEIKGVIRSFITNNLKKEAGKLYDDVQVLKEEKTKLLTAIAALRNEVDKAKAEIREEIVEMEKMMEKYARQILRYENMDL